MTRVNNGWIRVVLGTAVFVAVLVTAIYVLGELAVYYEMWATDTKERVDLAEDYGLGLIGVMVVIPVSCVLAFAAGWIVWARMGHLSRSM